MSPSTWGITPPYWDQNLNGTTKKKYAGWTFYFIQINFDGGETYHARKPLGFAALRVGRLGDIEQTATWNSATFAATPRPPPGVGWTLYKKCIGYCLWRREALLKKAA